MDCLPLYPDKFTVSRKALYGLKDAPRAWYDELSIFLVSKASQSKLNLFTKALSEDRFKYLSDDSVVLSESSELKVLASVSA
ncbi:hypothetical protein Tco_1321083 [Tanacetum coccineum]